MMGATAIVAPMLPLYPGVSPEIIAIAIGSGAIGCTIVTDSLFWLVKQYCGASLSENVQVLHDSDIYRVATCTGRHLPAFFHYLSAKRRMMKHADLTTLTATFPLVQDLIALKETTWFNPATTTLAEGLPYVGLTADDVQDAHARLQRFAPYLAAAFPETAASGGIIESEVVAIPAMKRSLEQKFGQPISGELLLKKDSHLPISGSIKARGGIYEVLTHAEKLALEAGLLTTADDYRKLLTPEFKQFFSQFSIAVGSTGNLGMSIGIMSARIGFQVTVHMSADARAWKKAKLRSHGVTVVEYEEDYGVAVEQGRKAAESDPNCFFIDDENSRTLFLGYAVAGERLKAQFAQAGRVVDADHPLFVYLPCGVGGGPGGVAFGLKLAFGDHVHCLFAEPTHSPCMLLGVYTGLHDQIAVQDLGIDNLTGGRRSGGRQASGSWPGNGAPARRVLYP